jgi:uncharacterized membrane protein YhaH (DUF805 family)
MDWYLEVLKKYALFTGRSRRTEYWMFTLVNAIILVVLGGIEKFLGTNGLLDTLYALAVLLPSLGVSIRRLHDTGRSGWWLLIGFLPFIGWLVLLLFMVQDSEPGENEYGPNPKAAIA